MSLIVVSDLTLNEGLYFRYLSMTAKSYLEIDVLIEAQKDQRDYYFKILKKKVTMTVYLTLFAPKTEKLGLE